MEEKIEPKKDINPIDICDFNIKAIHEMQMFNMFFIHFEIVHPKRNEGAVSCFLGWELGVSIHFSSHPWSPSR